MQSLRAIDDQDTVELIVVAGFDQQRNDQDAIRCVCLIGERQRTLAYSRVQDDLKLASPGGICKYTLF